MNYRTRHYIKCYHCRRKASLCNSQKEIIIKIWSTSRQRHFLCLFPHCKNVNSFSLFSKYFLEAIFLIAANIKIQCTHVSNVHVSFFLDKKKLISNRFHMLTKDIYYELRESCFQLEELFQQKRKITSMCYINAVKCTVNI